MNRIISLFVFVGLSFSIFGQYFEEEEGLSSRFKPGIGWYYSGLKPYEEEKLRKYDRFLIDLVYNDWNGDVDFFNSPHTSIGLNVSLLFDRVLSKANTFSFGWGVGFSHYNNRTPKTYLSNIEDGYTQLQELEKPQGYIRSKLSANYLEVPLEFRFRTKGYKHFKLMIGGKIGYQLNTFIKTVALINNQKQSVKRYDFPDSNPLRYGATLRIGIRNFAIYGAYYFSPLFTNEKSTQLTPFSIGLTISVF